MHVIIRMKKKKGSRSDYEKMHDSFMYVPICTLDRLEANKNNIKKYNN